MSRLIDADEAIPTLEGLTEQVQTEGATLVKALVFAALKSRSVIPTVDAVPLDKLCELLAEMYHCPSSGYPSSGHACHPDCTDEMLATICGMDCDHYSDSERWKAFLTNWMEGLDAYH